MEAAKEGETGICWGYAVGGSSLGAEESSELPADGKEQRNTEPHELPEGVHFPGGFIWLQSFSY